MCMSVGHFLIAREAKSRQIGQGYLRKVAEYELGSKPVSSNIFLRSLLSFHLQVPALSSCLDVY